jgi:F0F1-type ATP synthase delta subunit
MTDTVLRVYDEYWDTDVTILSAVEFDNVLHSAQNYLNGITCKYYELMGDLPLDKLNKLVIPDYSSDNFDLPFLVNHYRQLTCADWDGDSYDAAAKLMLESRNDESANPFTEIPASTMLLSFLALSYEGQLLDYMLGKELAVRELQLEKVRMAAALFDFRAIHGEIYAKALLNVTVKQDIVECAKTQKKIEAIQQSRPKNDEIFQVYVRSLYNLQRVQKNLADRLAISAKIETLFEESKFIDSQNPNMAEYPNEMRVGLRTYYIAESYARSLLNITAHQESFEDAKKTAEQIKRICDHLKPRNLAKSVTEDYAKALYNLADMDDAPDNEKTHTIKQLKALMQQYPQQEVFAEQYASAIHSKCLKESTEQINILIGVISHVHRQYPNNTDIACSYARVLYTYEHRKDAKPHILQDNFRAMQKLWDMFSDNELIAEKYASLTCYHNVYGDQKSYQKSVDTLKMLSMRFPDNESIAEQYAFAQKRIDKLPAKQSIFTRLKNWSK